ncbi:hypothetical protein RCH13_002796 [Chryseobacterium sp. MP_3.2]|nr:hypothetical protein [Chryseobacterium sp. MP_3.2]
MEISNFQILKFELPLISKRMYYISNNLSKKEIKDSFGVEYNALDFKGSVFLNGFSFPKTPVIMDENPDVAVLGDWGLIPF